MRKRATVLVALASVLALAQPAGAGDFSPVTTFELSTRRVNANPEGAFSLVQDAGEEELDTVRIVFDSGFRLATDAALTDGEQLGEGEIEVNTTIGCQGGPPAMVNTAVTLVERDRTNEEMAARVQAVWVVDIQGLLTIDLLVRGSVRRGWTLTGKVPQDDNTCPPFTFNLTTFRKAEESGARVLRNPGAPGRYLYQAIYRSTEGSRSVYSKVFRIRR